MFIIKNRKKQMFLLFFKYYSSIKTFVIKVSSRNISCVISLMSFQVLPLLVLFYMNEKEVSHFVRFAPLNHLELSFCVLTYT